MGLEPVAPTLACIAVAVIQLVFMTPEPKREASELCWHNRVVQRDGKPRVNPVCCPRVSGLVSLVQPAAEADGVEEAAVAQGLRVAAAELGHAALCELGAAALRRVVFHFDRRGGQGGAGRSGSLFGLLRGKKGRKKFSCVYRISSSREDREKHIVF